MDLHNKSGWLVGGNTQNTVDIDSADLEKLLQLADLEDQWAEPLKMKSVITIKNRVEAEWNF